MSDNEKPGDGFRWVEPGETLQNGDQFFWRYWEDTGEDGRVLVDGEKLRYRRRLPPVAEICGKPATEVLAAIRTEPAYRLFAEAQEERTMSTAEADALGILAAIREAQEERTMSAAEAAALGPDAPKNRPTVVAKSLPSRPKDCGAGYRWVKPGEKLRRGDQLFFMHICCEWANTTEDGRVVEDFENLIYRRSIDVAAPSAGVQSAAISAEAAPSQARVTGTGDTRLAQEPVAWRVLNEDGAFGDVFSDEDAARICAMQLDGTYVPLYRAPSPATLTAAEEIERLQRSVIDWKLEAEVHRTRAAAAVAEIARLREAVEITDAEREAVEFAATQCSAFGLSNTAATLRGLLARAAKERQ